MLTGAFARILHAVAPALNVYALLSSETALAGSFPCVPLQVDSSLHDYSQDYLGPLEVKNLVWRPFVYLHVCLVLLYFVLVCLLPWNSVFE